MQIILLSAYVIRGYSPSISTGAVDCFVYEICLLYSRYSKTWKAFSRLAI